MFSPFIIPRRQDAPVNITDDLLPKLHATNVKVQQVCHESDGFRRLAEKAQLATDIKFRVISSPRAVKPVVSVTFTLGNTAAWPCQPGDAFGVYCENEQTMAKTLLDMVGFDEKAVIIASSDTSKADTLVSALQDKGHSIGDIFHRFADISHFPKKAFLRHLSEYCSEENERNYLRYLSSRLGSEEYMCLAARHVGFVDFICSFPSCKPSLECLLMHVPLLQPRYYSVCGIQGDPTVEFLYTVMNFELPDARERLGVCSAWLEAQRIATNLSHPAGTLSTLGCADTPNHHSGSPPLKWAVFPREEQKFRFPEDTNAPIVMIGAGTGVAPFLGLLRTMSRKGIRRAYTWLIYGFRGIGDDFIAHDEFDRFLKTGILSKMTVAVSRHPIEGIYPKYVQDAILANQGELYNLMSTNSSALIYLCGDELTMIKGVNEALKKVFGDDHNVPNWEKRIIRDVWV